MIRVLCAVVVGVLIGLSFRVQRVCDENPHIIEKTSIQYDTIFIEKPINQYIVRVDSIEKIVTVQKEINPFEHTYNFYKRIESDDKKVSVNLMINGWGGVYQIKSNVSHSDSIFNPTPQE
ncbi:MAG TPA: hypothetical protein PLL09_04750 [Flavobacterium sp.]|uniref:hypothetical protein n=1 Tax=unclassified Flavobacterium TaxID=196869 RepID=UPI0025B94D99|nr:MULTISPECIES: hypothetical protein [unclassified Flavobacterium]HRE77118.1 hypothetical protein [Flavobacterium sp.]